VTWLKMSDTAAENPITLEPLTEGDVDLVNLVFGFVSRCAVSSAGYATDYFVSEAVAASKGGPNWRSWAGVAERAGYWTRVIVEDRPGFLLVKDSDNLFHIRLKDEVEWERARKRDVNNPKLVVPVRVRDGDGCRYCGEVVDWNASRGKRSGTYDHRPPGVPAKGAENLVVACRGCNSVRGDDPDADEYLPLLDVPTGPRYGPETVEFCKKRGRTIAPSGKARNIPRPASQAATAASPERSRPQRDSAEHPSDPAPSGTPVHIPRPAIQAATAASPERSLPERPRPLRDTASPLPAAGEATKQARASPDAVSSSLLETDGTAVSRVGSGRDGTGVPASTGSRTRGRRSGRRARSPDPAQPPTQHRGDTP
jgi:hypothetical protein